MKLPVSRPLTVEEYMVMNSKNTCQSTSISETGWQDDRFAFDADDKEDIEVHDLIIDEEYEPDIQGTGSQEEMKSSESFSDHPNIGMCCQKLTPENCGLHNESSTKGSNVTQVGINGTPSNDFANTDSKHIGVTHSSEGFIPILPLPVLNTLPVFNYTPFVFNGLSSSCLSNTTIIRTSENLVNSSPSDTRRRPMVHALKPNSIDTKEQVNKHDNLEIQMTSSAEVHSSIEPPETQTTATGPNATCRENGKRTGVNMPTVVRCQTIQNVSTSTTHSSNVELQHSTNSVNENVLASQDSTSPTQASSSGVDNLTDTINRVAAGEGVIRQRFTPKAKRRKISDLKKKSKQVISHTVSCKEKCATCKVKCTGQANLPERLCNNDKESELNEKCSSIINDYGKRINDGESNVENHYLLFKPSECEMSKLNFRTSTSTNTNVQHYLLETPPRTDTKHLPTQATTEQPNTNRKLTLPENTEHESNKNSSTRPEHLEHDSNKNANTYQESIDYDSNKNSIRRPETKEHDSNKTSKTCSQRENQIPVTKAHTATPQLGLPISTDSARGAKSSSMDPTVTLDRLEGVSPNTTVVLGKYFPQTLQLSLTNKGNTKSNDASKALNQQVNQAQLSIEPHSSATNIPSFVSHSTKTNLALKIREQPILRTTISDKTSNVYIIPKPMKHGYEQIPKEHDKIAKQNTCIVTNYNCDKTRLPARHDITAKSVPISPKAITQDVYQYLVSKSSMGTSLTPSRTVVCDRSLPQAHHSTGIVQPQLRPKMNTDSDKLTGIYNKPQNNVGEYSSKPTVVELLKTKRLGANCPNESPMDSPLKLYGKIVNGKKNGNVQSNDNHTERYVSKYIGPKINTESPTKSSQLSVQLTNVTCPNTLTESSFVTCSSVTAETAQRPVPISSESLNKSNSESVKRVDPRQNKYSSQIQNGIGQNASNYCTVINSSAFASSSQRCSTNPGSSKSLNTPIELANPFSIKIGSKMYVVKPKLVLQTPEKTEPKSPRSTLPAPKPKSVVGGKRSLDLQPGVENSNEIIKKKIKRIVNRKKGPFDKLTQSLKLMPIHKKEKRLKQMLKKRGRLSFSPNRLESQGNLTSKNWYGDKKDTKGRNETEMHHDKCTTTEPAKMAITMTISKASAGNLEYSIHRTKINYMPRQHRDFRRWFKHSNFPCTLHFKEGKLLDQIDVATIKQGLYLVIGAEKPLSEVERQVSSSLSTVLALYPPHVAAIPYDSDAVVIGHIDNVNDTHSHIASNTIDDIEQMLRVVLGPKAMKSCDSLSDERYTSIVDTNMSLRNHSPLFYSKDMHEYFTDGGTARELDSFTDKGVDKKHAHQSRSSTLDCKEQDTGKAFMKISEKAMALKMKQTKLMESCQKLQHERNKTK